jgi:hypothetical protein
VDLCFENGPVLIYVWIKYKLWQKDKSEECLQSFWSELMEEWRSEAGGKSSLSLELPDSGVYLTNKWLCLGSYLLKSALRERCRLEVKSEWQWFVPCFSPSPGNSSDVRCVVTWCQVYAVHTTSLNLDNYQEKQILSYSPFSDTWKPAQRGEPINARSHRFQLTYQFWHRNLEEDLRVSFDLLC